ncbi:arylsulfatase [Parabacteroides sp. An277]|uniref:sulfatase family protein n=1 Tax=Parabacteroides sp. An277 TaxID=1965619 RepID=UPI000B3799B0|nr:arylsulfatase [Parabacteroides sp. An277]OUO50451.1 arylsulfatase [Parabacteroides sp. An277]
MKDKWIYGLGLGTLVFSACNPQPKQGANEKAQQPNVIFIVADDLGYGDMSCYGAHRVQTPNVDSLAAHGLRFTDAHAVASTSTPSRYSLFTGLYSWRRNDTGIAAGNAGMVIRPEQTTIADVFKAAGYATGAIGKWHLGLGDKTGTQDWNGEVTPGPRDLGFDYSYLMAATGDRVPCVWMENQRVANYDPSAPIEVSYEKPFPGEPLGKDHPEMLTKLKPSPNHGHDQAIVNGISRIGYMKGGGKALWEDEHIADSIAAHAVGFIDAHKDAPFFLYVGTNDIHVPRYPNERFRDKSGMGYRGDAILQFDWTVGEILKALDKAGIRENTLIVLTSDNGPVVDDGYADRAVELLGDHRPWGDFRGGKYSNFEAGTRVPFIVSWKGKVQPGVSNALFSHIDMFSSMEKLANQDMGPDAGADSQECLATLLGQDTKGRRYIIEAAGSLSISDGSWKYIRPSNGAAYNQLTNTELGNDKQEQLYDLKQDIGEKNNVAEQYPEKVAELKQILEQEMEKGFNL